MSNPSLDLPSELARIHWRFELGYMSKTLARSLQGLRDGL